MKPRSSHCFSPMAGIATTRQDVGALHSKLGRSHCFSPMAGIATTILRRECSPASRGHSVSAQWQALLLRLCRRTGQRHIVSAQWQALLRIHDLRRTLGSWVTLFQPNGRHCYASMTCAGRSAVVTLFQPNDRHCYVRPVSSLPNQLSGHIVSAQWQALLPLTVASGHRYVTLFQPNGRHCYRAFCRTRYAQAGVTLFQPNGRHCYPSVACHDVVSLCVCFFERSSFRRCHLPFLFSVSA